MAKKTLPVATTPILTDTVGVQELRIFYQWNVSSADFVPLRALVHAAFGGIDSNGDFVRNEQISETIEVNEIAANVLNAMNDIGNLLADEVIKKRNKT